MATSIGVVFGPMDESTIDVLSYLTTCQNALQESFEFRIVSSPEDDPFLESLSVTPAPSHDEIVPGFVDFLKRVSDWNNQIAESYDLKTTRFDKIILLTDVRFSDNYFYISSDTWAVIALGGWQSEFAPPSIVEYYLSFIVALALDNVVRMGLTRHYETTGCVFDFSASLHHARLSVLSGHLCETCATKIERASSKQVADDARVLLKRAWLGEPSAPSEIALTVQKLGYDLFRTAGIKPTFKERCLAVLEQEGLKNGLNITFQILLATALLIIGIKK